MDSTYNTLAIILKREDRAENDSLVTVFSGDKGKLKLIARGAKKIKSKSSGHIEPLTLSRLMVVKGKDFDYVGTAKGEDFFHKIKEDLDKVFLAGRALFLVDKMTREGEIDGYGAVFQLLEEFLGSLETGSSENLSIEVFSKKLADITGFSLEDFKELCR